MIYVIKMKFKKQSQSNIRIKIDEKLINNSIFYSDQIQSLQTIKLKCFYYSFIFQILYFLKILYIIQIQKLIIQEIVQFYNLFFRFQKKIMGRQIKKTIIKYQNTSLKQQSNSNRISATTNNNIQQISQPNNLLHQDRQRSRQKININSNTINQPQTKQTQKKEVVVDVNSRKARLEAMRRAREQKQKEQIEMQKNSTINNSMEVESNQIKVVVVNQGIKINNQEQKITNQDKLLNQTIRLSKNQSHNKLPKPQQINHQTNLNKRQQQHQKHQQLDSQQQQSQQSQKQQHRILHKPVFLSKTDRQNILETQDQQLQKKREQQRKKKNLRYTTKILLQQNNKKQRQQNSSDQEIDNVNDDQDETNLPDDSDDKDQQIQYQMWKIRQLKRIRRDREIRQKHLLEKTEIERRRQMNNQQILLQNRLLGSDSTDNDTETKYVFMQKYYHKGAFYQDNNDPIFNRDYNLPTPMEMQDKSALPSILQKRKGNFGKKGQSKYTHLTAQDTTDTNPLTRADQSILNGWKKKMAGYKN